MANLSNIITPTNVLTASSTNTLTNKTISGASNTVTNIPLGTAVTGTLPVANGGTGATTLTANNVLLGNGTSAVQVVAPGASGNVLTSNGTTWTSAAAPGGLTLLQTITASNSATVDLETGIGSTYSFYLITFTNVTPTVSDTLRARMKIGGSYITSSTYLASTIWGQAGSATLGNDPQSSTTNINISGSTVSATGSSTVSGELWFSNPTSTSLYKMINFYTASTDATPQFIAGQGGGTNTSSTSALSGIRFYFNGGDIATGVFRLYGLANS